MAAYTAACHAGDLDTARRLFPPDAISRKTELRMQMHETNIREICQKLSHTRPKGEPRLKQDGEQATVMLGYEQPPEGTWYPEHERPPLIWTWFLTRQGRGWAITMVAGL